MKILILSILIKEVRNMRVMEHPINLTNYFQNMFQIGNFLSQTGNCLFEWNSGSETQLQVYVPVKMDETRTCKIIIDFFNVAFRAYKVLYGIEMSRYATFKNLRELKEIACKMKTAIEELVGRLRRIIEGPFWEKCEYSFEVHIVAKEMYGTNSMFDGETIEMLRSVFLDSFYIGSRPCEYYVYWALFSKDGDKECDDRLVAYLTINSGSFMTIMLTNDKYSSLHSHANNGCKYIRFSHYELKGVAFNVDLNIDNSALKVLKESWRHFYVTKKPFGGFGIEFGCFRSKNRSRSPSINGPRNRAIGVENEHREIIVENV